MAESSTPQIPANSIFWFGTTLYYGHAWGKGVISSIYPKDANGQLIFLETNFHF
jgi:hypothetical protein